MKTLFCPECNYPLAIVLKGEKIDEWKACPKCGVPSYLMVNMGGESSVMSLAEIFRDIRAHKYAIDALTYILKNDSAWLDDLELNVGKLVENDLSLLVQLHVLNVDRAGKHYFLPEPLKKPTAKELIKYVAPQQWLRDMV
jgi:hypothetical protein